MPEANPTMTWEVFIENVSALHEICRRICTRLFTIFQKKKCTTGEKISGCLSPDSVKKESDLYSDSDLLLCKTPESVINPPPGKPLFWKWGEELTWITIYSLRNLFFSPIWIWIDDRKVKIEFWAIPLSNDLYWEIHFSSLVWKILQLHSDYRVSWWVFIPAWTRLSDFQITKIKTELNGRSIETNWVIFKMNWEEVVVWEVNFSSILKRCFKTSRSVCFAHLTGNLEDNLQ